MFENSTLKSHLENSSTIHGESLILGEINMNDASNFEAMGNYRYRPTVGSPTQANFGVPATVFDSADTLVAYTGATDSDIVFDGGVDTNNNPVVFSSIQENNKLIFSLEDCFNKFRPRSGINKAIAYGDIKNARYGHNANADMMNRPRYYISSKEDKFKYWTSYRQEQSGNVAVERGISNTERSVDGLLTYYIDDAAPFIVYKEKIPVNRIILKMQTHVGTVKQDPVNVGTFKMISDPLFDEETTIQNRTVPMDWKIQYLEEDATTGVLTWRDALDFGTLYPNGKDNGVPVISRDGYVELHYGQSGSDYTWYLGTQTQDSNTSVMNKFAGVVELGPPHQIGEYEQFMYIRGLRVVVKTMSRKDVPFELIELSPRLAVDFSSITKDYNVSKVASDLGVSGMPVGQLLASVGSITIADFDQVLNENNQISITNPTGSVIANFINKNLQLKFYEIIKLDLDDPTSWYYVPIKTLYAESFPEFDNSTRTATISLRDLFFYFESLTAPEILLTNASLSYAVAMLMDSIGFSNYQYKLSPQDKDPIIPYFFIAPETSVAQVLQDLAIATQTAMYFDEYNNLTLMSKRYILPAPGDRQPNNPDDEVDIVLYGTQDFQQNGILKNERTSNAVPLTNIKAIASADKNVYNDGLISYTSRHIQKSYGEIRQASLIDQDKSWQYKPVLLWEIEPNATTKSINQEDANQSSYALTAIPLNSKLSNVIPTVNNNYEIINNTMDFGEGSYWLARYNGYFYANGEIIRYDAVEYSVAKPLVASEVVASTITSGSNVITTTTKMYKIPKVGQKIKKFSGTGTIADDTKIASVIQTTIGGVTTTTITLDKNVTGSGSFIFNIEDVTSNMWLSSVQEYQDAFAQIPFNGKMYPTGRIRIFAEPYYESYEDDEGFTRVRLKPGAVNKHGRGQFGTTIVNHEAGIEGTHWTNNDNIYGMFMDSRYLFDDKPKKELEFRVQSAVSNSNGIVIISNANIKKGNTVRSEDASIPPNTVVTGTAASRSVYLNNNVTLAEDAIIYIAGDSIPETKLLLVEPSAVSGPGNGTTNVGTNAKAIANQTTRTGIIKNFLSSQYYSEDTLNSLKTTQTGAIQSSALIMTGASSTPGYAKPQDFISYIKKDLAPTDVIRPKLFGARMRIVGRLDNNETKTQTPYGANPVTTIPGATPENDKTISAASGGIGFMIDPTRNRGYFLEIAALNVGNVDKFATDDGVVNMVFYKTVTKQNASITKVQRKKNSRAVIFHCKNSYSPNDIVDVTGISTTYNKEWTVYSATSDTFTSRLSPVATANSTTSVTGTGTYSSKNRSIPFKLWEGLSNILVDDGKFTGQYRLKGEQNPTVYDIAVEYEDIYQDRDGSSNKKEQAKLVGRRFYIYLNQKLVGTVVDDDPLPVVNNIAPFIRSTSKVMFEKIYAVGQDVTANGVNLEDAPLRGGTLFNEENDTDEAFRKYSVEDSIQNTYMSGISPLHKPDFKMYIEEFGTIMREAAYFNIKYDKAYPAFISKIAPTFNKLKGYTISGYVANAYGAEFLVFNTTDMPISLDETTGNYLRILGVTFTQESNRELTVDEFMKEKSDLSSPDFNSSVLESSLDNPSTAKKNYRQIQNSRALHGKNEFNIDSIYIQSPDQAEDLMEYLISKSLEPRLSVGLQIFPIPTLQLGDIVTINYKTRNASNQLIDEIASPSTRFVVYNIEYSRDSSGPQMTVYLSEVS